MPEQGGGPALLGCPTGGAELWRPVPVVGTKRNLRPVPQPAYGRAGGSLFGARWYPHHAARPVVLANSTQTRGDPRRGDEMLEGRI